MQVLQGRKTVISKLDLAMIVVSIAGALVWMEHAHRIVTDAPTPAQRDALAAAAACPDNENVPYSKTCIDFMQGGSVSTDLHWRVRSTESAPAALPDAPGQACPPNNENVPYSANCIKFMSGRFWRPNTP
jgi:hypothetical protein